MTDHPDIELATSPASSAGVPEPSGHSEPFTQEPTDHELIARHVAGDADAFSEIIRRHQGRLWSVAVRTTGDPEEAADALQDAMLSAYRAASSFRGDSQVTTWLHRIVVNACLDRLRRRQARPTMPLPDDDLAPAAARDILTEREVASEVYAALSTLPAEQRACLVLVDIEGYPVDEAARLLDVPVGTVKSRCARGRARLAPLLVHLRNLPAPTTVEPGADHHPNDTARKDFR